VKAHYAAKFLMNPRSMRQIPFSFQFAVNPQTLMKIPELEKLAFQLKAQNIAAKGDVTGLLASPRTWRGEMIALADHVTLTENHGGRDVVFDQVQIPARLQNGRVSWNGVKLIGEDVSLLGNGEVSPSGGLLAVTRLVVSPEVAKMLSRGISGAGIAPGSVWWQNLDTPDRKVRDLTISGDFQNLVIDAGFKKREILLLPLLQSTVGFIREEMHEEGKDLEPILRKKEMKGKEHSYENH